MKRWPILLITRDMQIKITDISLHIGQNDQHQSLSTIKTHLRGPLLSWWGPHTGPACPNLAVLSPEWGMCWLWSQCRCVTSPHLSPVSMSGWGPSLEGGSCSPVLWSELSLGLEELGSLPFDCAPDRGVRWWKGSAVDRHTSRLPAEAVGGLVGSGSGPSVGCFWI